MNENQMNSAPQNESDAVRTGYIVTQQLSRPDKGGLTPHRFWIAATLEHAQEAALRATAPPPAVVPERRPVVEGPGWLIRRTEWPKRDAAREKLTSTEAPMSQRAQPEWWQTDARQLLEPLYRGEDLVCIAQPALEAITRKFADLRSSLHLFHKICPQAMAHRKSGAVRERRFLVLKFCEPRLGASWRRVSYMSKTIPATLVVLDAAALTLESWHYVDGLDEAGLKDFARTALTIGAQPETLNAKFRACMPSGPAPGTDNRRTYQALFEAKLVKSEVDFNLRQLANRNLVMRFDS